ncbi:nucleotidyltransferase family protein [Pseudonocardia endophytica]|uniref:dTDP-glucose pyrophosphorylase n=1 Tax=Pseudonocardia endophytica TaxID=401976 RepID=A0A4R1HYG3_PSEEN|nr:NTP transferase domain-containing protein [Pseudonocardia endophytica]TCK25129.1 dTDP-glucose pyrophosphorylase [Pseudonocardia endophytica]
MDDLTLLVLAAGRSTRYGRLKQTDPVGPSGETIVDYSVFDALRAGFSRVVFVLRTDIEQEFRETVGRRIERQADVRYAFQDRLGPEREKPWGTVHALLAAQDVIDGPFGVVNADDFYGPGSHRVLAGHMASDRPSAALVGFALRNTLSESGGVTRGICRFGPDRSLVTVDETYQIVPDGDGGATGSNGHLPGDAVVSMNMWGFRHSVFEPLRGRWEEFLGTHGDSDTAELTIPPAVTDMIGRGELDVTVLHTDDRWFGVTHPDDRPLVVERLRNLSDHPSPLWGGA